MVDILLSTYNGEKYLEQQLDSLLQQTYNDIRIIIRDDGSTDNTLKIIQQYSKKSSKISIYNDKLGNLGYTKSFLTLLEYSKSDYIAFCDQDDIWDRTKVEKCINSISDYNEPALSFCDLELVDSNLNTIHKSYFECHKRDMSNINFESIINDGVFAGCTMLFNKQLKDLIRYKDINKINAHDDYVCYIAACFSKIIYVNETLIKHRETGTNTGGGLTLHKENSLFEKAKNVFKYDIDKSIKVVERQMQYFYALEHFKNCYFEKLNKNDIKLISKETKTKFLYSCLLKLFYIIKGNRK